MPDQQGSRQAALDHRNGEVGRLPQDASGAAALPQVVGEGEDPGITNVQVFNHQSGPLPLSAPLTTHGGVLAIFVSGTGSVANYQSGNEYITGLTVSIDGNYVGQATFFISDPGRHTFSNVIIANGIEHGDHTITLDNFKDNIAPSEWDLYNLTVMEL